MVKNLSILGSTGSIGTQAAQVATARGFNVVAIAAGRNAKIAEEQIRRFSPKIAAMADEAAAKDLAARVADTSTKILSGEEGIIEVAKCQEADTVLNSIVGIAGLAPTLAAIEEGKDIALANKETIVTAGEIVMKTAAEKGVKILPVDSEHSAIFQCLQGAARNKPRKILLTASGGPFFGRKAEELKDITPAQALKHPNWDMGAKITIDSATLMNKGLEVIEAVHLFGVSADDIEVIVHRESIIHSAVEFEDGAVIAQMGIPDMKLPIQYALTYPERYPCDPEALDLKKLGKLTFFEPDKDTFRCLAACLEAIRCGGLKPAAANGANELAVEMFLKGKIGFLDIGRLVWGAMENQKDVDEYNINDVFAANIAAREFVKANI